MAAMNLNTNCYVLPGSASSAAMTFIDQDKYQTSVILYNSDATYPVFIVTGTTNAPTAVVPTSATAPLQGFVLAPGSTQTFTKKEHEFLSAIWTGAATGKLYVSVGQGE